MDGTRRDMLTGLGTATAAGMLGGSSEPPAAAAPGITPLVPDGRLPVNRERAYRFMKDAGVDAIVGGSEANARYLTNMRSVLSEMGFPLRTIGIMPADPRRPIVAVTPPVDLGRYTRAGREWPEILTYTVPDAVGSSTGVAPHVWPVAPDAPLTATEQGWRQNEQALPRANLASPELAVVRALRDLGLSRGHVAIDDPALAASLPRLGMTDLRIAPGDNLFLKIRQVKSPVEIDRMRTVSRLNDGAARAMIAGLVPGMSFEEVQAAFFVEVARRGGRPEFIVAGMTSGLRSGRLVAHEPFLVDCCANFDGYSGDFARTVVLGAPSRLLIERTRQLGRVASEVTAMLRPGVRYSEIRTRGAEIARKLGATFPISFGPHSVGLTHSDDPWDDSGTVPVAADVILEPGIVLTVDLPTLEPGWGSTHLESLILITREGAEWLDRADDPLYEVAI